VRVVKTPGLLPAIEHLGAFDQGIAGSRRAWLRPRAARIRPRGSGRAFGSGSVRIVVRV